VRFPNVLPGIDLQLGRMAYTSGAEAPSGMPKIEAVKRQRLDSRLVGEFEWSYYQRGFDGIRVDAARTRWRATGIAVMPTQGGFAHVAGPTITDIVVAGGTISSRPAHRPVTHAGRLVWYATAVRTQRPDNMAERHGCRCDAATFGGVAVSLSRRTWQLTFRVDGSPGWPLVTTTWARSLAAEGGYQWTNSPWRPWIRGGVFHAGGDDSADDGRHGTFFPMLPTLRRFSQTTVYSTMNLRDRFVQVLARPRPALGLRLDVRRLALASAADLWYGGSGATLGAEHLRLRRPALQWEPRPRHVRGGVGRLRGDEPRLGQCLSGPHPRRACRDRHV
jgi:hypothetical protein